MPGCRVEEVTASTSPATKVVHEILVVKTETTPIYLKAPRSDVFGSSVPL
jgi:hypothetical protein